MGRIRIFGFVAAATVVLSACGLGGDKTEDTAKPTAKKAAGTAPPVIADMPGTPMAQRVAVVGLLNKRNGNTRDIELKPGQALRIGDELVIRVRACERTQPWETHPDIGIFVQLLVNERSVTEQKDNWRWAFSGWLFKENPAKNVVQHPVYDVWVKDCRMTFPGEHKPPVAVGLKDAPVEDDEVPSAPAAANTRSNADQSAPPRAAPVAAPEPEPEVEEDDPVPEPTSEDADAE